MKNELKEFTKQNYKTDEILFISKFQEKNYRINTDTFYFTLKIKLVNKLNEKETSSLTKVICF